MRDKHGMPSAASASVPVPVLSSATATASDTDPSSAFASAPVTAPPPAPTLAPTSAPIHAPKLGPTPLPALAPTPGPVQPDLPPRPRPAAGWEHFEHGADIGVRGWAPTKAGAYAQAARALTAVVVPLERVRPAMAVDLSCRGVDDEALLVAWLNTLVHAMTARRMLFVEFELTLAGHRLRARARGEPLERARHEPAVEIKGATYTALRVAPVDAGWLAQAVVDV